MGDVEQRLPKQSVISMTNRRFSMTSDDVNVKYDDVVLEPILSPQVLHIGHYANDNSTSGVSTAEHDLSSMFDDDDEKIFFQGSIDKVKHILDSDDRGVTRRPLFCEMLYYDDTEDENDIEKIHFWKECSRWIKFEETVEEGGTRWSKPHITILTIQSLLQIRNCLNKGGTLFDAQAETYAELIETICSNWTRRHALSGNEVNSVRTALLAPKLHLVRNKLRIVGNVPYDEQLTVDVNGDTLTKSEPRTPSAKHVQSIFSRKSADDKQEPSSDTLQTPKANPKINQSLFRKIPEDSEAACIFVGFVGGLKNALTEFVRLKEAKLFADVTELPVPTRFIFVLLLPIEHRELEGHIIGRSMGTLMVDDVFSQIAYKARNGTELAYGVEEFLDQCAIVPAGKWNRSSRWEPPENQPPAVRTIAQSVSIPTIHHVEEEQDLRRTGKLFGGFVEDVKLKAFWYKSDYVDAFRGRLTQTLAAAIFLFFTNISKIITFGGVMDHYLHHQIGAIENVLAGGICGIIYALFAGQPLCALSATGPCLVFEVILYNLCQSFGWQFLVVRAWVGFWTAVFLMILVAVDASVVVGLITRFTEEAFATLISLIFLVKAFEELMEITHEHPVTFHPQNVLNEPCVCIVPLKNDTKLTNSTMYASLPYLYNNDTKYNESLVFTNLNGKECHALHGLPEGDRCFFSPEVFMFSIILMVSTFVISIALKMFRHSSFGTSKIRNVVADFNAIIAIGIMTTVNYFVGLSVPCLNVPDTLKPTIPRNWIVNPFDLPVWWISLVTILPAAFFSILVMMDQNITSVIINRPDNKLKKGYGYHLDLAVISILMIVCSVFGIPFYVAATVISLMHVDSLRIMSQTAAPGEKPQFLGIREQRVTALVAHILIGLAVFLTPVMKLLPMPVLLGVFLYIGIVSLAGQQFVQRILLLFMPMKHQPDYPWLRLVRMKRVHLFTAVQLISFLFLLIIEENKKISMVFPLMLVILVLIRKIVMERIFTHKELCALDDPLPSWREMLRSKKVSQRYPKISINAVADEKVHLQKLN